jgi:hypothetical protein
MFFDGSCGLGTVVNVYIPTAGFTVVLVLTSMEGTHVEMYGRDAYRDVWKGRM